MLDRPLYRSQRMLYPLLAGGGGFFSPETIVWALIVVNVLAMGAGTLATASIAKSMAMSPWWGLTFAFNLGFISEMNISGAGIVAAAAAFGAVAMYLRDRRAWGVILLALAVLSRRSDAHRCRGDCLVAVEISEEQSPRRPGPCGASRSGWSLGALPPPADRIGVGGVPSPGNRVAFVGFVEAIEGWASDPLDMAVGVAIMLLFVLYTRRVLLSKHLVGWAFLGFVALGVVFTRQVWQSYFDITRAVARR